MLNRIAGDMASLEYLLELSAQSNTIVALSKEMLERCRNLEVLSLANNQLLGKVYYC